MKMKLTAITILATAALLSVRPAHADGKCGDDPYAYGTEGLVVTWSVPAPKDAVVRIGDGSDLDEISKRGGGEFPSNYPERYRANLSASGLFNQTILLDGQQVVHWQKAHGIVMKAEPMATFEKYYAGGFKVVGMLVNHPKVSDPVGYSRCDIVLQRALIVHREGVETLQLRSHFYSAKSDTKDENFAPKGALELEFKSPVVWFPFELSQHIDEPASYVEIDLLTDHPLASTKDGKFAGLNGKALGEVTFKGKRMYHTRISDQLKRGVAFPDLKLKTGN